MKIAEIMKLLPTDSEVEKWYDMNISEMDECSASSAIYKFRLYLKERFEQKLKPIEHNISGFNTRRKLPS